MIALPVGLIGVLILAIVLFVNLNPQFGGNPSSEQVAEFEKLDHFRDGKFQNLTPTEMTMGFAKAMKLMPEFFKNDPSRRPDFEIPVEKIDSIDLIKSEKTRLIWFGHSAFLIQMDGKNILLDPMFGDVPAPHPWLGNKRFFDELPIEIEQLPEIDLVLFSHDHYDHLDYESVQRLKSKTRKFLVPLGVGSHLENWDVPFENIEELDWWEERTFDGISYAFTPSRHFSGRGLTNRFSTLWGSWVIRSDSERIYFSGDSGYGPHFQEIGAKYGPFDLALLECGQYNENWKEIHMMPEETAQAGLDLRAKQVMPIHWGAFRLAMHSWTDPVDRLLPKAEELDVLVRTPLIGSFIPLESDQVENFKWWINPHH
ncbi:MAG: MBL fold metallo-hydrolase [Algoriphagus sp.]|nr:MBL fold metallo-hydrolase [Algoriphagus sp.]